IERAAVVKPEQRQVKRVVAEIVGKNAIIIDEDADLDEAVPAILHSALGFQGQKCSACSRLIVLDAVHDRLVGRLVDAAKGWKLGPSEDPSHQMGALIDGNALAKFREYATIAKEEGHLAFEADTGSDQNLAPITIVAGIKATHRIAREEVFGPLLAVICVEDFDEALEVANSTEYALTGGLFSRTPSHLERAKSEFEVGNLYLNRGITGALVGRQAFGGAAMSGVGSKAGGPDYLLQFMNPKVVTENTMRRGFAPDADMD
ncbi:MAG: aldehyde dehydrogenase family protein, partial [Verrucomicrobiota bacterium]